MKKELRKLRDSIFIKQGNAKLGIKSTWKIENWRVKIIINLNDKDRY